MRVGRDRSTHPSTVLLGTGTAAFILESSTCHSYSASPSSHSKLSLVLLMQKAYVKYEEEAEGEVIITVEDWRTNTSCCMPAIQILEYYFGANWRLTSDDLRNEPYGRETLCSYIESLTKIVPWFFALDHTHYS